jgi:hypothetical protein
MIDLPSLLVIGLSSFGLTNPRYSAPTPSFFAILPISMNVHPSLVPEGVDWALDFHTSAGVFKAVPASRDDEKGNRKG